MLKRPVHPGAILQDELAARGIIQAAFAAQIAMPAQELAQIIAGARPITRETALRIAGQFGTGAQFWLNLQEQYESAVAGTPPPAD